MLPLSDYDLEDEDDAEKVQAKRRQRIKRAGSPRQRREGANSFEDDGDDDDLEDCYGDRVVDMRMKRREQNYRRSKKNNSLETLRITSDGRDVNRLDTANDFSSHGFAHLAPKASPSAPRREAGDRGGLGGGPRQQHENDNDDGFDDAYESEASEDSDDDDEDVSSSVFRRRRKLRRPPAQDQEAGGGSHTPYHLIEILINSGSDNLPGISRIRLSEMLRRRSTPHAGERVRPAASGNQTISLAVPTGAIGRQESLSPADHGRGNHGAGNWKTRNEVPLLTNLARQTTLTLLTLEDDDPRRGGSNRRAKRKVSDDETARQTDETEESKKKQPYVVSPTAQRLPVNGEPPPPYRATVAVDTARAMIGANASGGGHQNDAFTPIPMEKASATSSSAEALTTRVVDHTTIRTDNVDAAVSGPRRRRGAGANDAASDATDDDLEIYGGEDCCSFWPWFLQSRPILRLFLIMFVNGLVSMMCAAIFIQLEGPSQKERMAATEALAKLVEECRRNISSLLTSGDDEEGSADAMASYGSKLLELTNTEEEIEWEMLSASAFVTSVSSTTGYGDIVPVTLGGKIFTLAYALYSIPVFMWYITKLGVLFRTIVGRMSTIVVNFFRAIYFSGASERLMKPVRNVFAAIIRPIRVLPASQPKDLSQEFRADKRFHPTVIGSILIVFMTSVAAFISYMEGHTYFDAFYACFITYSTIGFGDIDIYRTSYRSNWFNLMIYGNCVHIVGYMIVSAWVSSILTKCGVRKVRGREGRNGRN